MRPVRLEVEGFTSFRARTELDFSGLTMFAITGPTGAGKTSILDAIVYALYGRTPRLSDDFRELVSQGALTMRVALEFKAGGELYKVMRVFGRKTDIRLERSEGGSWKPIADKVRQVNECIEQILGLDFNGFTRSVILPQGEFDEFLRGDPGARKKILTQLMGLEVYGEMRLCAAGRRKELGAQLGLLEAQLATGYGDATEERRGDLQNRLDIATNELERLRVETRRLSGLKPLATQLREHRARHRNASETFSLAGTKLEETRQQAARATETVDQCRAPLAELDEQIRSCGYDEAVLLRLTEAVSLANQRDSLDADIKQRTAAISAQKSTLPTVEQTTNHLDRESAGRSEQAAEAQRKLADAQRKRDEALSRYGSADRVRQAAADLDGVQRERDERKRLNAEVTKLQQEQKSLQAEEKALASKLKKFQREADAAESNLEHLRALHAAGDLRKHLKVGEACAVCEQIVRKLPPALKADAVSQAKLARDAALKLVDDCRSATLVGQQKLASIPGQLTLLENSLAKTERAIQSATEKAQALLDEMPGADAIAKLNVLAAQLSSLEKEAIAAQQALDRARVEERAAQQKASEAKNALASARQRIQGAEDELQLRVKSFADLLVKLNLYADLGVDLRGRLTEQQAAKKLRDQLEKQRHLAAQGVEEAGQKLADCREQVILWSDRARQAETQIHETHDAISRLEPELRRQLPEFYELLRDDEAAWLESRLNRLSFETERLVAEQAGLQKDLEQVARLMSEAADKQRRAQELRVQAIVYEDLARHLEVNRLPEYIQRRALSQLVADATRQMESLSSGRYAFALADNDNNFCVIDHWNADDRRPVSTLSGGESFLASLSLALALAGSLSPYCANRDRLQLDSLFLDEGFSTLDPETLDLVVSAIESLRGDDRMVGIISHVPELAERLDEQVRVEKSAGGSTIHVDRGSKSSDTFRAASESS